MKTCELLHRDEAGNLLNRIQNPVTKRLILRALTIARHKFYATPKNACSGDFDLLFFTDVLSELFQNPDVIRQELAGQRPGAWSADDEEYQ